MPVTTPPPAGSPLRDGRDTACSADSPPGFARPLPHVPGVRHRFVTLPGARLPVAGASG